MKIVIWVIIIALIAFAVCGCSLRDYCNSSDSVNPCIYGAAAQNRDDYTDKPYPAAETGVKYRF